jgi:hypothetical protein
LARGIFLLKASRKKAAAAGAPARGRFCIAERMSLRTARLPNSDGKRLSTGHGLINSSKMNPAQTQFSLPV